MGFQRSWGRPVAACGIALVFSVFALAAAATPPPVADVEQKQAAEWVQKGGGPLILDVGTPEEFADGHVPGAINIPHDALPARIGELASHKGEPVLVYCERGGRAAIASKTLQEAGFSKVEHLAGDMSGWRKSGLPIEK